MEYVSIAIAKKTTIGTAILIGTGLDYVKCKLHHFKRPTALKVKRNPHIYQPTLHLMCRAAYTTTTGQFYRETTGQ